MDNETREALDRITDSILGTVEERETRARNNHRRRIMDRREFLAMSITADRLAELDIELWFDLHTGDLRLRYADFDECEETSTVLYHLWEIPHMDDALYPHYHGLAQCDWSGEFYEELYTVGDCPDRICESRVTELYGSLETATMVHGPDDCLDPYQIADRVIAELENEAQ